MNSNLKHMCLRFAAATVFALSLATPSASFAGYMEMDRATKKKIKQLLRKNLIPTSMKCINPASAGKFLKPKVTFTTTTNKDNRDWVALAYKGQLKFKPDIHKSSKPFAKRYEKVLKVPSAGRPFHCSLWIGPKGSMKKDVVMGWSATTASGSIISLR